MRHVVIAVIGVALWVIGFIVSMVIGAGNQPWGQTLSDNFMFARSLRTERAVAPIGALALMFPGFFGAHLPSCSIPATAAMVESAM